MATCTGLQNDSSTITINDMKKRGRLGVDSHRLPGLSISAFHDLFFFDKRRNMKGHESKMKGNCIYIMQNERNMRGFFYATWKATKGNENKRWHLLTRLRMLSHPQNAGKITLLVYRELTTWENDRSKKNDNVILGHSNIIKIAGFYTTPHG